jgi:hypothetical protein
MISLTIGFPMTMDSLTMDSPMMDSLTIESLTMDSLTMDSLTMDSLTMDSLPMDSLSMDSTTMDSLAMDSTTMDPHKVLQDWAIMYFEGWSGFFWPNNRILVENILASKVGYKKDLNIAPMSLIFTYLETYFL